MRLRALARENRDDVQSDEAHGAVMIHEGLQNVILEDVEERFQAVRKVLGPDEYEVESSVTNFGRALRELLLESCDEAVGVVHDLRKKFVTLTFLDLIRAVL